MKTTFALILVTTAAVTACTRVIERPAPQPSVVTTPAIIERSSVTGATTPPAPAIAPGACLWEGQQTSNGGMSCREHSQWRCNNGSWEQTVSKC